VNKPKHDFKKKPLGFITCKLIMRGRYPSAAKAAIGVLLDHVSWRTFRCDPSLSRVAWLSGYSLSNVQAGIKAVADDGILIVHRHGGRHGNNAYEFCWQEILRRDEEFQNTLHSGRGPTRKQGATVPDIREQTLFNNPNKEPERVGALSEPFPVSNVGKWQPRREIERNRILAFRSTSAGDAAQSSALRRWNDDLLNLYRQTPRAYALAELIDIAVADAATKAEMKRHGNGLRVILDHVRKTSPALFEGNQIGAVHEGDGSSLGAGPLADISDPDNSPVKLSENRPDNPLTDLTIPKGTSGD
jgi:hypothetical protein